MKFVIKGGIVHNDVQTMAQVFYQNENFALVEKPGNYGLCLEIANMRQAVRARLWNDGKLIDEAVGHIESKDKEGMARAVKFAIFSLLVPITKYRPPWGLLTGIRPAKLAAQMLRDGISEGRVERHLKHYYLADHNRARLCIQIAHAQEGIVSVGEGNVSVYISIPFCPSICHYCSFSSYPMDKFGKYENDYVAALVKEIEYTGRLDRGKFVENVYIGGGTPTVLNDANFEKLLGAVSANFNVAAAMEYSVEAGRPDTITDAKLSLMKKYGVNRISVNPQTLNDSTLARIGRRHSAADFFRAYEAAAGYFDNINIDIILGLAGEDVRDMCVTMEGICGLEPNSVTVHILAIKRASRLHQELSDHILSAAVQMESVLAASRRFMAAEGLYPYYMYRQKNSLGNLENVGYCRPGFEGRYNIQIMDEGQSVYAVGAGAVTKLVGPDAIDKIERVFNLRNPVEYIQRVDDMIERKRECLE